MFGSLPSTRLRVFMRALLALATALTPVATLGVWSTLPGIADNTTFELAELPPLPRMDSKQSVPVADMSETNRQLWFKILSSTSLKRFAELLQQDPDSLAALNQVPVSKVFEPGTWLALPASARIVAVTLSSLDPSSERQALPVAAHLR